MLRSFLASLVVTLFGVPTIGWAADSNANRYCGDDYYFTFTAPRGWADDANSESASAELAFAPVDENAENEGVSISVSLRRAGFKDGFDLDSQIERAVAELTMRKAPTAVRDGSIRHPSLPSRSAVLEFPDLHVYYVLMDAQSGRGYVVAAVLARVGGRFSAGQLALFESSLASLHYDAGRVCKPGPDDEPVETVVSPPAVRDTSGAATKPELTKGQRAMHRALMGCSLLSQLFVPVVCMPGRLAGTPALLAEFQKNDSRSAETILETFRDRVAATYCWAAQSHELPRLAFGTHEKKPTSANARPIREYSCQTRDFIKSYPPEQFDYDRSAFEGL